ncbi:hypothetical protein [Paenibacillus chitinolyticus]|uniref:CBM6 domain-containing protein n=1 Tax=Paenibacillus chitinolyticus TaxID=79263 RepID=A0ABT4FJQ2_9BACL|nr:hypothetical protein [Paenibacillus chitinolyticus]MCY9589868.1 hypothetical protein [Paenibacillus chitinolyticus]MCY9598131.1 hypothetical protein [Paenibacillus chitinolyticus]
MYIVYIPSASENRLNDPISNSLSVPVVEVTIPATSELINPNVPIHKLSIIPPTGLNPGGFTPFGEDAPTGNTATNLADNDYNYSVDKLGYKVYTNAFFTGVSKMRVSINNFKQLSGVATGKNITITLYKSNGSAVSSTTLDMSATTADYTNFSGLDTNTRYYVLFSTKTNDNTYSFNGTISKG